VANSFEKDDVKLFFRSSEGGLDSLYGYELLRYKSSCKKIVLSACESGLGTYEKGEGLFSLPRYFMLNGATDVKFHYWDVED
jgi:CHAT domain-containing protein